MTTTPQRKAKSLSDEQLRVAIGEAQNGCAKAFTKIVDHFRSRMLNVLTRMLQDDELAQDCYQEACHKLYLHIRSYNYTHQFNTWFYTIALNLARNHLRRFRKLPHESIEDHLDLPAKDEWKPEISNATKAVEEAILTLPHKYQEAYTLKELHQWEYTDIAVHLAIPLGTVKSRVYRAREMVRNYLKHTYPHLQKRTS